MDLMTEDLILTWPEFFSQYDEKTLREHKRKLESLLQASYEDFKIGNIDSYHLGKKETEIHHQLSAINMVLKRPQQWQALYAKAVRNARSE